MRAAWICVIVLLSAQALAVEASTSHDDEVVSGRHALSKRHIQPILNRINGLLGTGTTSTTPAPEAASPERVAPVEASPDVVQPASDTPADVISDTIPGTDASPLQEELQAARRSKRSPGPLQTIDHLVHLPHQKLEEFLRSLPGGKFVVEDHYDATAPKPIEEVENLFMPASTVGNTVSINKKIEVKLPTKSITKEVKIEKGGLLKLLDPIKDAIKSLLSKVPVTPPAPPLPPKALPPPVALPVVPPVHVKVVKDVEISANADLPIPIQTTTAAPVIKVTPVVPAVLPPVSVIPAVVVPPTEAPPTTTPAPLLEASISKVVKIPLDDGKPEIASS